MPWLWIALAWLLAGAVVSYYMGQRISQSIRMDEMRKGKMMCLNADRQEHCERWFKPNKCKWERTSKCLDGLEYCDACKRKGTCGCHAGA